MWHKDCMNINRYFIEIMYFLFLPLICAHYIQHKHCKHANTDKHKIVCTILDKPCTISITHLFASYWERAFNFNTRSSSSSTDVVVTVAALLAYIWWYRYHHIWQMRQPIFSQPCSHPAKEKHVTLHPFLLHLQLISSFQLLSSFHLRLV